MVDYHEARFGDRRALLLGELRRFLEQACRLSGIARISLVGSITTPKHKPKDVDVLILLEDVANLAGLAALGRRLQGQAQQFGAGADIFLADSQRRYVGRTCHWKECRPGIRLSCDALHCGRVPHLHDDLQMVTLRPEIISAPPLDLWPEVIVRTELPDDLARFVDDWRSGTLRQDPNGAQSSPSAGGTSA